MKKICLILLLPLLMTACGTKDTTTVSLTGEIKGLGNDTIYLYATDNFYNKMDTIPVIDGKFTATLKPDTLVAAWLQFSDGTEYPLYMDKGNNIRIKGSAANLAALDITGNKANEELSDFLKSLGSAGQPSEQVLQEKAEEFINNHPTSLASIYLLEKYFILKPNPDYQHIKDLTERMSGELKDRPVVSDILERIIEEDRTALGKAAPFFSITGQDGKMLNRTTFKDQYLLIHFWASWDEASRRANQSLRRIYLQEKKNKDFAMLGISLDVDKASWQETIRKDSLEWKQACNFEGWEADILQKFGIQALPANILLSPSGKIEAKNLDEAALSQKLEKIKQNKEAKKAQKKS